MGQTICQPVKPRCESCDLSSGLCPSAKVTVAKRSRKTKITAEDAALSNSLGAGPRVKIELELEEAKYTVDPDDELTPPPSTP